MIKLFSKPVKNPKWAYLPDEYPNPFFKWGNCPDCNAVVAEAYNHKCPECGRRIDWWNSNAGVCKSTGDGWTDEFI